MDHTFKGWSGRRFPRDCKLALFKITSNTKRRILGYFKDGSKKKKKKHPRVN